MRFCLLPRLAVQVRVALRRARADREHAVAAQHTAPSEQAAVLPVGEAQLGPSQRILAVYPAGHAVADERRVDPREEAALRLRIVRDQARRQPGTVPVEEADRLVRVRNDGERDLGRLLPLPLATERFAFEQIGERLVDIALGAPYECAPREPLPWHKALATAHDVQAAAVAAPLTRPRQRLEEARRQLGRARLDDAADV